MSILHGREAVNKVKQLEGYLTPLQEDIVLEEGYSDGAYADDVGIRTRGVGQTGEWYDKTFKEAFDAKLEYVRSVIHRFDYLSHDEQSAMVSLGYRGDLGGSPTFRRLWNEGSKRAAALELLNHKEYIERKLRVLDTGRYDGVVLRLERNQQRLLSSEHKV